MKLFQNKKQPAKTQARENCIRQLRLFKTAEKVLNSMDHQKEKFGLGDFVRAKNFHLFVHFGNSKDNVEMCLVQYSELEGERVRRAGHVMGKNRHGDPIVVPIIGGQEGFWTAEYAGLLETAKMYFEPSEVSVKGILPLPSISKGGYAGYGMEIGVWEVRLFGAMYYLKSGGEGENLRVLGFI